MSGLNRRRIAERVDKLIAEISGYILKREEGITAEEERIAIIAACGGMAIRVGQDIPQGARKLGEEWARIVATQIAKPSPTTDFVAPPNASKIEL